MISRIGTESPISSTVALEKNTPCWQRSLRQAVSTVGELLGRLDIPPETVAEGIGRATGFPLRVPLEFVARMEPGNLDDPLLRQVLPVAAELAAMPGFVDQPLQEEAFVPVPGLIHKYAGRVLIVATGTCAVNCRYCFRRNFPYGEQQPWRDNGRAVLNYIANDPTLGEVILSGGDPLAASDHRLSSLVAELEAIPHVAVLRIHTRLPIVLPSRVDGQLTGWLAASRLRKVVVLHCNHAQEIDSAVTTAVGRLAEAGCTVLNQAVLLAGVNDTVVSQVELNQALFRIGVLPYYLHLLDRVQGAAHFEVSEECGREIVQGIRERLPGYLVPRLVREVPGTLSKVPV